MNGSELVELRTNLNGWELESNGAIVIGNIMEQTLSFLRRSMMLSNRAYDNERVWCLIVKYHVLQVYNPELAVEETVTLEIVHTIKLHQSLNLNIATVPVWPPTYFWTGFQVGTQRFAAQVVEEIRRLICTGTTNVHQLEPWPWRFRVLSIETRDSVFTCFTTRGPHKLTMIQVSYDPDKERGSFGSNSDKLRGNRAQK